MQTTEDARTRDGAATAGASAAEAVARRIRPSEVAGAEAPGRRCLLVDVRTPAEYREAHIEGSVNVPLADLAEVAPLLRERPGEPAVLVCRTGRRAGEAAERLARLGLEAPGGILVLEGGIAAWETSGLPLVRGRAAMSLERQVRVAAGSLVVAGVLAGTLLHPAFLGLSAFVGAGLVFAGLTDTCGMAMLLARMPWNRLRREEGRPG